MRALVVQHYFNERLGLIGEWAMHHCVEVHEVLTARDGVPDPTDFDFVIVLGSHASVYDTAVSWIPGELDMLRRAVDHDVPVLGVCFGAQLLAKALGGEVAPAPVRELGWTSVDSLAPDLIPSGPWWEHHSDRFTVPPGAVELARTDVCTQAFAWGPHLGVQFHPEIMLEMHQAWVDTKRDEVVALGLEPDALLEESAVNAENARWMVRHLMTAFREGLPAAQPRVA